MIKQLTYGLSAIGLGLVGLLSLFAGQTDRAFASFTTIEPTSAAPTIILEEPVLDRQSNGALTVVELFTSQGCSSCPPADSVLTSLADRPNILALSWAVDYWDRLGWRDTFSSPLYSKRQRAYNRRIGRTGVYTPQMFVNGLAQAVGSRRDEVNDALTAVAASGPSIVVPEMRLDGDQVIVTLPEEQITDMVAVHCIWFQSGADVSVGSGENRGRQLHYTNVVKESKWSHDWEGAETSFVVPLSTLKDHGADGFAVMLQAGYADGPIIGASYVTISDNR